MFYYPPSISAISFLFRGNCSPFCSLLDKCCYLIKVEDRSHNSIKASVVISYDQLLCLRIEIDHSVNL